VLVPWETRSWVFHNAFWFAYIAAIGEMALRLSRSVYAALRDGGMVCLEDAAIVWAVTAVDLALYAAVGAGVVLLAGRLTRGAVQSLTHALLATLTAWLWLLAPGRLWEPAALILAAGAGAVWVRWSNREPETSERLRRRTLRPLAITALLASITVFAGQAAQERGLFERKPSAHGQSPSVLLVVLDTVRADRMSLFGYARPTTPFLEQYAREAVVFDKAFATSSWTLPSHVSFFTGRAPREHGATLQAYDRRFPTLAQVLARRGYATAGFAANLHYTRCSRGISAGFQHYEGPYGGAGVAFYRASAGGLLGRHILGLRDSFRFPAYFSAAEVNRRFFRWLDAEARGPFFAFLNYMDAHLPVVPPEPFAGRFVSAPGEPQRRDWDALWVEQRVRPELQALIQQRYDAAVAYLDDQVRALLAGLRQRGHQQNLLVVILSDHGESLGEHGLFGHQSSLYREQIHVPLILRRPGGTPANHRVAAPVSLRDVAATIADLAAVPDHGLAGSSLRRFWSDPPPAEEPVDSEVSGGPLIQFAAHWPVYQGWIRSRISGRWHLLWREDGPVELYDWIADPEEKTNVATTPEGRAVMDQMAPKGAGFPRAAPPGPGCGRG